MYRQSIILVCLVAGFSALTAGCSTNNFAKFYTGNKGEEVIANKHKIVLPSGPPVITRGTSVEADEKRMLQDGYLQIGYSSFNAGQVNEKDAIKHGEDIHAAVVVLYSAYTHTNSGAIPLTMPNTQTSTTQMSGTSFGPSGMGNYTGTANTTTYGSRTMMMPYNVARYDYGATYWVKSKPMRFGVHVDVLTDAQRKQIGTNKGVQVLVVVRDTPAFHADIMNGDIIKQVGAYPVYDLPSFFNALDHSSDQRTTIQIVRDGQEIKKEVEIGSSR